MEEERPNMEYVLEDSEDERQGSAHVEGPPAAARPSSLPTAHLDPSFFADVFPLPGPLAPAVPTSGSADGTATFQELSKAPGAATAGQPTSVGKQKENHFLGVEVPTKIKERTKSKTKTKRAKATEVKSAAIVEDSDDEVASMPTRKASSASRRACSRSASTGSRSASTGSRAPSVPTDYDEQPPHVKSARPKKSRAVADSEEEDEEGVIAQHIPTTAGSTVSRTTSKRARSNSVVSEASAAAKPKRRQSRAISEDGDDEWMRAMEAANEKAEDEDSDFGGKGGAAKKGKGKGKKEKAKKEKVPAKEKKARTPRVKKGAAPVEPQPLPSAATTTSEEPATATGSTSAAPLPPAPVADAQLKAVAMVEEDEDEEEPVVAPLQRKTSKKARVVLESDDAPIAEDSDHVGASTSNSKQEEAIKSKTTRKRVAPSSDEDDGDTPAATEEIASVDDNSPVKSVKRSRTMSKGKGKAKATSSSTSAPAPLPTIAAGPGRRTSSATAAERMDAVMRTAEEGPEESLLLPQAARGGSEPSQGSADKSDDEAVKENDRAKAPPAVGTPVAAVPKRLVGSAARGGTPGLSKSTPKHPRSLAGVIEKTGFAGHRAPGLSSRSKIPRLHTNLKPPPPPKAALPKEKERKKKGHESYSDEDKPWYEIKHPEEWDDEDHHRYRKVLERKVRGLDSDD